MQITFHGAAQTVTGSKHLIKLDNGTTILLDCGMFQGHGKDTDVLNTTFGFNPSQIDYVVLSHAHIDHSGLLPRLVSEGFKGQIFCTPATAHLCKIMLQDAAKIQEADTKFINKKRQKQQKQLLEPLFTIDDALATIARFVKISYHDIYNLCEGVQIFFTDAGHITGSAAVHLDITENDKTTKITFSGDVGRYKDMLLKAPETFRKADYLLLESTYGDSLHQDALPAEDKILSLIIETCVNKKGKLIIPAFSVGRTQEILYLLNNLEVKGVLPAVKYFVDSPLSEKATLVVKSHPGNFNDDVQAIMRVDKDPFDFIGLRFVEDTNESIALNNDESPMVIISSSGMAEAGRVKHHIKNSIENPNNTILMVGYSEPSSLAGRLKSGVNPVGIFGDYYQVNARIESLQSMSAHGDQNDLLQFINSQDKEKLKKIFLVHGDFETQTIFKNLLQKNGFKNVEIPQRHQTFNL